MSEETKESGDVKWWEFYAVRYAMGTVVGALTVFLLCTHTPGLSPLLLIEPGKSFAAEHILLLGAYGLTYCYIASAPILVFHSSRFMLTWSGREHISRSKIVAIFGTPLLGAALLHALVWSDNGLAFLVSFSATYLLLLAFLSQIYVAYRALLQSEKLFDFYRKLANKRAKEKTDIVDSYRHLREHGNSFAIVFLEVVLGVILFSIGDAQTSLSKFFGSNSGAAFGYISATLFWMTPAVFVWLIGTAFERRFAEEP